ncbi:uncharacterized protein [Battus philenor]|uniref:uncharacterized protein n=1 Tax=Battus philenor TaxID=42288 RepID=UPI0035CFF7C6
MSGMVDALRGKDELISLTDNDVSLIASIINATCICGFFVIALLGEKFGRRHAISIISVPVLASYIMIYFGKDKTTFILSRIMVGISYGGVLVLTYITTAEYTNPTKRTVYVNVISSLGPTIGTALGHILSVLLPWRTVALIGLIPTGLSALLPFFWVESPPWLASQGKYEECMAAFRRIHGKNKISERELKMLIETERNKRYEISLQRQNNSFTSNKLKNAIKQKCFWKVVKLGIIINIYKIFAGKVMFNTLAITMLQEITGSSNIILFTFVVDGFILLGSGLSFFFLYKMKMRPLLFSLAITGNLTLLLLSTCLYFIPRDYAYYSWINISLLAIYFIITYSGPYSVTDIYLSEIFPLDVKLFSSLLVCLVVAIISFLNIYLAQSMFTAMGYHGTFLINAVIISMCLTYLWLYLPETKGRTLQEIEMYFKNNKFADEPKLFEDQAVELL